MENGNEAKWFAERLTALRMEKGVSSRDMSLALGQNESYINKIENRRALPSMAMFFEICDYFGISPAEFFDRASDSPALTRALAEDVRRLPSDRAAHIHTLILDLLETN